MKTYSGHHVVVGAGDRNGQEEAKGQLEHGDDLGFDLLFRQM